MKSFRSLYVIPILIGMLFAVTKLSYDKAPEETSVAYSITVYTSPACYSGSCWAIRQSDGAYFALPSSGSSYTAGPPGMDAGVYDVYVCCGYSGMGHGVVTLYKPSTWASITLTLGGQCQDQ